MFSGIVTEVGTVREIDGGRLAIAAHAVTARTVVGGSIAVNGVCLTASDLMVDGFSADVMPQTMRLTTLGALGPGSPVNLEAALKFGEEVGGHLVQGHIDGTGTVVEVRDEGNARWVTFEVPEEVRRYCVIKGSIAVDGTSLTIAVLEGAMIKVSLIPHTLETTVAAHYRPGSPVNLEADVLAKYVAAYMKERN
jgi:riboflavin synthase